MGLQEMIRKRRYGRCQKAMGDTALLAGSPADAAEHYNTAAELCRLTNDLVWTSAALEGLAHSKVGRQLGMPYSMPGSAAPASAGEDVLLPTDPRMPA